MRARDYIAVYQRAFAGYGKHNGDSLAASIAYKAIFSIFPLLLLAITVLGFFLHGAEQRRQAAVALFNVLGPGVNRDDLRGQVDGVAGGNAAVGLVGVFAATWSGLGVFDQIRRALNLVWDSNKPRPWFQQKLTDLGMLLTVGMLLLLSVLATGVLTAVAAFGGRMLGNEASGGLHTLFYLLSIAVPAAILFCAFTVLYRLVPDARITVRAVWLGAATAAVAFEILQLLFATYVANFGHYNRTYGALGGIIAFLFFVYVAGAITLLGAEVAKAHLDLLSGIVPVPESRRPKLRWRDQIWDAIRGLFVDVSADHNTNVPHEPGRQEPLDPNGRLLTDEQSAERR